MLQRGRAHARAEGTSETILPHPSPSSGFNGAARMRARNCRLSLVNQSSSYACLALQRGRAHARAEGLSITHLRMQRPQLWASTGPRA